jgi:hypothetical protein
VKTDKGRKHDFRMFKESKTHIHPSLHVQVDTGYQGIKNYHTNIGIPYKRSKKKSLTKEQLQHNHTICSSRMTVEHVIRELKIFRILSERYRNRRKRFGLRVNLIAALFNYELKL